MKLGRLLVFACLVGFSASIAAQETPRLLFEVSVDGSVVARPEMRVPLGGEGRIELDESRGDARLTFSPTLRGDSLAIAFDITRSDGQLRPTLVITRTLPGSLQWASRRGGRAIRIDVSWIR